MYWLALTTFICVSFKQSSTLQQDWSSVNGNMTAYRLQSGTSCIGYKSDNGSSSRRVFSCTTACIIYIPAISPACVGRSLPTIAVDTYDQLHAVTSSFQPQKQTATALVASPSQDVERGTWNSLPASLRHDQMSVASFRLMLKVELFTRAYDSSLARSWLFSNCKSGRT